jgi:hypothetical protein
MNKELLVTLLRKDIQELDMITEGFMEMTEYPKAIIQLANRKAGDIQYYIQQLANIETGDVASEEVKPIEEVPVQTEETKAEAIEKEIFTPVHDFDAPIEFGMLEKIENPEDETLPLAVDANNAVVEEKEVPLVEKVSNQVPSRNELLNKGDNSIGSLLANKKISDIKQAINIGDRFRFQRELFKGNGEDMNKTLHYINQLATFDEVWSFLQSKYNWTPDNESVEDFYQIVRRRFL